MRPRASFPLWREKGLCKGIQTSPRPRTDPNYRFGLSQSQSTFHQIMQECIHFLSPPSAKQTKTQILGKLLVVRKHIHWSEQPRRAAGIISVNSGWKLIDKRFNLTTHEIHKWTPALTHHLDEYFFVLKWLGVHQQKVLGSIPSSDLSTPSSVSPTSISATNLPLAVSVLMVRLSVAGLVTCPGCKLPLFCDSPIWIFFLGSPALLIKSWKKEQLIGSPIRLTVSFRAGLSELVSSDYFILFFVHQHINSLCDFLLCLTYACPNVNIVNRQCLVETLGAYFIWTVSHALKISLVKQL